jgi:WD40 repeat protein
VGQKRTVLSLRYNTAANQFMAVFLLAGEGASNRNYQTMLERWSPNGASVEKPKPIKAVGARFVAAAAFAPNCDLLALATIPYELIVVNPGGDAPLFQLPLSNYTSALVFSPDGRRIAAAGDFEQIRIWEQTDASKFTHLVDFDLRRLAVKWGADIERVTALAFSPDGRFLASAHSADRIAVWDTQSPEQPLAEYEDQLPAGSIKWLALLQPSPGDLVLLRPWDDQTTRRIAIEPVR